MKKKIYEKYCISSVFVFTSLLFFCPAHKKRRKSHSPFNRMEWHTHLNSQLKNCHTCIQTTYTLYGLWCIHCNVSFWMCLHSKIKWGKCHFSAHRKNANCILQKLIEIVCLFCVFVYGVFLLCAFHSIVCFATFLIAPNLVVSKTKIVHNGRKNCMFLALEFGLHSNYFVDPFFSAAFLQFSAHFTSRAYFM